MFIGCDTTSAFYGKGKVTAFKVAVSKSEYSYTFAQLGQEVELSNELIDNLTSYVCHLYVLQEHSDINAVRFQLFKGGKYEEELLPPNQDSLNQHDEQTINAIYGAMHIDQCYMYHLFITTVGIEKAKAALQ